MAKLFLVDVSAIPTHEDRYDIMKKFETSFEVYEKWVATDPLHRTFYCFEIFWPYESPPPFPHLPKDVKITEK